MSPRIALWTLLSAALTLTACDDGGGDDGGADAAAPAGPTLVAFTGEIPALPADPDHDDLSFFPLDPGGVWRYRKQTAAWQSPPPVSQGAEVTLRAGDAADRRVRRTVVRFNLSRDGESVPVEQVVEETFVLTPDMPPSKGPGVNVAAVTVEERVIADGSLVRRLERTYSPPYMLVRDVRAVDRGDTNLETPMVRLTEVLTVGGGEPESNEGIITARVETERNDKTLPIEGNYRSKVRELHTFDDFNASNTRTLWLQQGVGPVQLALQSADNITFTLVATNHDPDWAVPPPPPEDDAGAE